MSSDEQPTPDDLRENPAEEPKVSTSAKVVIKLTMGKLGEPPKIEITMNSLYVRLKDLVGILGSLTVVREWEAADWIKATREGNRLTTFSAEDVLRCYARRQAGEVPKLLRPIRKD